MAKDKGIRNTDNGCRSGNKLNFPSGEEESELHDDGDDNNTGKGCRSGNKLNFPSGEEESELHGDGNKQQTQPTPASSSSTAALRQKQKRANKIERRGQKKVLFKRAPRTVQKKQQQQHHQQQTDQQYELQAVHAYFRNKAGKEAYYVSWLAYRNKEWVLSVDIEGVEMTKQFSRETATHSTLKALCGKPISNDQKKLIEADPYFKKLKEKFGAQLPDIETNKSDIWWAPNTQPELKQEAIAQLSTFTTESS